MFDRPRATATGASVGPCAGDGRAPALVAIIETAAGENNRAEPGSSRGIQVRRKGTMAFNKLLRQIAGSLAAACLATGVFAQTRHPMKPVKIIVPYTAGAPADIYSPLSMDRLQKTHRPPFVIQNRPRSVASTATAPSGNYDCRA